MDTNLIKDLIAMMEAKSAASAASGQNTVLIVTMIITALAPMLASIMAYFKAAAAKTDAEENKASSAKAAESLKEIHVAVNSKEAAAAKKMEDLEKMLLKLTEQKATSDEQLRGVTTAAEVERAVSKERGLGGQSNQFQPQHAVPHVMRTEAAAEKTEAAAEKVEVAAEKTEKAIDSLTDVELSVMVKEINAILISRRNNV